MMDQLGNKWLNSVEKKYSVLATKLARYNERSLKRLQKQEQKLQKKLARKDSLASKSLFGGNPEKYASIVQKINHPVDKLNSRNMQEYLPELDSLQTTFDFLHTMGAKIPGVATGKLKQVQDITSRFKGLQAQLQNTADIKRFVKERKQLLKEQFDKLGMGRELKKVNKEVYYYQQQISEYKSLLNDPEKLEKKILGLAREIPALKEFISKNSLLAQLFPMPGGYGTADALMGLQTRPGVQQQLSQRLSGAGANPQQYLQQQVQAAQGELNNLKDKVNQLGGGSSEMVIPDFKPNSQKTKSFWKRMEYGLNIQSQKTNAFLPTTSDIALSMGYKLNDKSTIGIGAGYKLGWGKNISNIKLTSQGVSLRSYLDIKLKGSIWISGGYEENYQHEFTKIYQLKDMNAWQKSGLIGLTKKYKVGKKNGNMQLLWDFLSYRQVPSTSALKFRIGYSF
ncbi:MAG: hypothetical protein HYU70_18080 [Bacteroidetes bacterium]|nr:hypothetical protein [Bacteroidota bacterium]